MTRCGFCYQHKLPCQKCRSKDIGNPNHADSYAYIEWFQDKIEALEHQIEVMELFAETKEANNG